MLCVCCAKKPEEVGWRGGAACSLGSRGSGELLPWQGVWLNLFREPGASQCPWGGEKRRYRQLQEKSLELQSLEVYSWQEERHIHIGDKVLAEGSWTQLSRSGDNRRTFSKS